MDATTLGLDVDLRTGLAQRREFLRHIDKLERDVQRVLSAIAPRNRPALPPVPGNGPRLLTMKQLELVRDALSTQLTVAEEALAVQVHTRHEKRSLLKRMTEEPTKFRWARVTSVDVGLPGCLTWESVPRLGPVGMVKNWWRIRISSGCP